MQRITAEQVVEAYKKTGAIPMRRNWYETSGVRCRACALTAMSMAKEPTFIERRYSDQDSFTQSICKTLGISFDYLDGFTDGFDKIGSQAGYNDHEYLEGFKDGEAAGEAVDKQILYAGVKINAEDHS